MTSINANSSNKILEVGYGRVNITPDYPVRMAGSAAVRISEGYLDPLYVTCVAIRQDKNTFLVITMDFVGTYEEFANDVRANLSKVTGIEESNILLNSTHTHSSVSNRFHDLEGIEQYRKDFLVWSVTAAKYAINDLSPADVLYGSTQTKGMAWVRHYKMADGTYAGANYGSFESGIVGHASEADQELQLIKFERTDNDKKDIVLMNFPAHATMNQKSILLSADFPGPARDYISEKTDTLVAYFIAGGGDQVPVSKDVNESYSTDYQVYGKEIGRIAVECMKNLTKVDTKNLSFLHRTFVGKSNKTGLERSKEALAVKAIWDRVGGRSTEEGKAAAIDYGFSSVYQVTAILNRMAFEDTRSLELKTMAIGDIGFVFAPYEMFGSNAMEIKKNSPYALTFIISCSQNHDGYLPSKLGWQLMCYEAQITRYALGTAEQLADEYVDMLKEMKTDI